MAQASRDAPDLIGGVYGIDFAQKRTGAAPPSQVFAATRGRQPGYMAVAVERGWPARPRPLSALQGVACPGMLAPLAHGPSRTPAGETGYFVICPAPPGPSLAALRPWPEAELMEHLLKPAAHALAVLQDRNLTHRAIRPDNLFQAAPNRPVALGCAWAAPPACHQPAWLEPPASAACLPTGRGDGTVADDVYALGAVMVMLALGADPVAGVSDDELLRRKLDGGSYAAIVGTHRLPPILVDLLRGMLADDPEHRPSPALLLNPAAARARRVASRPPRRAQRPLELGSQQVWTTRMLAHAIQAAPDAGVARLREGVVAAWLRRGLGDGVGAGQIDAMVHLRDAEAADGNERADALMITRCIATLDTAAPLVWRSLALWPDGLGPALDHGLRHAPDQAALLAEMVAANAPAAWQERRNTGLAGSPRHGRETDLRSWSLAGKSVVGTLRLSYSLNPLAPCASPATSQAWVTRRAELLPALEAQCERPLPPGQPLVDDHVAAFVEARQDERLDTDVNRLAASVRPDDMMSQIRLLAQLQAKLMSTDLPHLSRRAADLLRPMIEQFSSRSRREGIAARAAALAQAGQLTPLVTLLDDGRERAQDTEGHMTALARIAAIDAALAEETAELPQAAKLVGRELVEGVSLLACVVALAIAVFG